MGLQLIPSEVLPVRFVVLRDITVELVEIDTRPESLVERFLRLSGSAQRETALEDDDPGGHGSRQQQEHDQLDHQTGIHDQMGDGHGVVHEKPRITGLECRTSGPSVVRWANVSVSGVARRHRQYRPSLRIMYPRRTERPVRIAANRPQHD